MILLRKNERASEFIKAQDEAMDALSQISESGGIPGFEDLEMLKDFVDYAVPVCFDRRGVLNLAELSDDEFDPKVLIAKKSDPEKHLVKFPSAHHQLNGKVIDRSSQMRNNNVAGFMHSYDFVNLHIPTLITIKTDKPSFQEQSGSILAHEVTHWMDAIIADKTDLVLQEKRAHFVNYYIELTRGTDYAQEYDGDFREVLKNVIERRGFGKPGSISSMVVAVSKAMSTDTQFSEINEAERLMYTQLGVLLKS